MERRVSGRTFSSVFLVLCAIRMTEDLRTGGGWFVCTNVSLGRQWYVGIHIYRMMANMRIMYGRCGNDTHDDGSRGSLANIQCPSHKNTNRCRRNARCPTPKTTLYCRLSTALIYIAPSPPYLSASPRQSSHLPQHQHHHHHRPTDTTIGTAATDNAIAATIIISLTHT